MPVRDLAHHAQAARELLLPRSLPRPCLVHSSTLLAGAGTTCERQATAPYMHAGSLAGSLSSRFSTGRTSVSSAGSPPTSSMLGGLPPRASPRPHTYFHPHPFPPKPALPSSRYDVESCLGSPDCTVRGAGFKLSAHSAVLKARCPIMRAQFDSGMRDSDAREIALPPNFGEASVRLCLDYLYSDVADVDEETALPTLAVAIYFSIPHLVSLCSSFITAHLCSQVCPFWITFVTPVDTRAAAP
jgi:hypothetical protein